MQPQNHWKIETDREFSDCDSSRGVPVLHPWVLVQSEAEWRKGKVRGNFSRFESEKKFEVVLEDGREESRTTLMIKNIPNKYTKRMMMEEFDRKFKLRYDFFYLPIDFQNQCNVGYAFINFVSPSHIREFFLEFHNKKWRKFNSSKICAISYARIQGKEDCIRHFENSALQQKKDAKLKPYILGSK